MQKYYLQAMKIVKARERLYSMDANIYPHVNEKERRKKHKDIYRVAFPEKFNSKVVKTTDLELI